MFQSKMMIVIGRFLSVFVLLSATPRVFATNHDPIPHLDLDASSQEIRQLLKSQPQKMQVLKKEFGKKLSVYTSESSIEQAISLGERLLRWIDIINAERTPEQQIRLTSPQTRRSYPITAPNRYSPARVAATAQEIEAQIPAEMADVLYQNSPLPSVVPVTDEVFIEYGRKIDRNYQTAARWKLLFPYKQWMIERQRNDVRGFYYFKSNGGRNVFSSWATMTPEQITEVKSALAGICINSGRAVSLCTSAARDVTTGSEGGEMYDRYIAAGIRTYNQFFDIQNPRSDMIWNTTNSSVATIPFYDPSAEPVRQFIQSNIEDEFKLGDWGLKINFVGAKPAPFVVFIPGVTANVEYLGGNKIEMDANKSLDEYEEQWTIRHEFGHVLGLPDCYHEFFDDENHEFVNYQIDVTDLMCSRAGNMTQRIFDQLKAAYFK